MIRIIKSSHQLTSHTTKMSCLDIAALVVFVGLGLGSLVEAGRLEAFIVNVEEITNTNKECKQTVINQKSMMADFNSTMENLQTINAEQDAIIENLKASDTDKDATIENLKSAIDELNSTLSLMQHGEHATFHTL